MQKASLPKGSRDFAPDVLKKRLEIIDSISKVYTQYGFEPLETPAMENLLHSPENTVTKVTSYFSRY